MPTLTAPNPLQLLTRDEAAELLGIAVQTLALWHSTGRYNLPCIKVGRLVRYRRADIEEWLRERTGVKSKGNADGPG